MELTESIENINKQLEDLFGIDTITGRPMWRVSWSEDQLEKRLGTYNDFTREGLFIRTVTEVREVPKYRQWIREKFVLENLTIIPDMNAIELPAEKLSYEPIYVFEDRHGNYLPPKIQAAEFVVNAIYEAKNNKFIGAKYKDPTLDPGEQAKKLKELEDSLFGNETELGDSLAYGTAIAVPGRKNELQ